MQNFPKSWRTESQRRTLRPQKAQLFFFYYKVNNLRIFLLTVLKPSFIHPWKQSWKQQGLHVNSRGVNWCSNTKGCKTPDCAGALGKTLLSILFQYQSGLCNWLNKLKKKNLYFLPYIYDLTSAPAAHYPCCFKAWVGLGQIYSYVISLPKATASHWVPYIQKN